MKNILKFAVTGLVLGCCFNANAKLTVPTFEQMPVLAPEQRHSVSCLRIFNYFTRAHYKVVTIDNAFTKKVIDRFVTYLDYNHSLYTKKEIDEIYANAPSILQGLEKCYLDYPYAVYNENIKKRYTKYKYMLSLLDKGINLNTDKSIEIDRTKAEFAKDEQELKSLWEKELINDYEVQLLNGKSKETALKRIKNRYIAAMNRVAQVSSEDVFSIFENSFATAIDPHTNYFGPVESENFNDDINLSLEGIGAVLSQEDEFTVIESILPGSPAEKSKKLKPKDRIVGVKQDNGKSDDIIGWRLTEVVKKIKGKKGTKVILEIERGDGATSKTFNVELVRDKIRLQDKEAKSKVYDSYDGKKIGVITISSFYTDLHQNVIREINKLTNQDVDAIVVDLRNNGGGLLPEGIFTTGLFIKSGPVVLVRDVNAEQTTYDDTDSAMQYKGPLVVLINRLSASASEIMAAALQDYGRALIVGDNSYGKGTVQQSRPLTRIYDLKDSHFGSIHYTIAKFYRINGGSTQLRGVTPDITLPTLIDVTEFGEKSEPNALEWDSIKPSEYDRYISAANITNIVKELEKKHNQRIAADPVFNVIKSEQERYAKLKAKKVLSINYDKRLKLFKEDEAVNLANTNTRLKAMGKDPVKNVKDIPDDFVFDDPLLKACVNIASDFSAIVKEQNIDLSAQDSTPILLKYRNEE